MIDLFRQEYKYHIQQIYHRAMPKIRKQPKRQGKKLRVQSLRNPFNDQNLLYLPVSVADRLKHVERIVLRHIDQLVCEPQYTPEMNIEFMKEALYQQQLKISGLKSIPIYSSRKKSITQAEIDVEGASEQKSSNKELEEPVQIHNLEWILGQNEPRDFF